MPSDSDGASVVPALGAKARDRVTGFEGTVTARAEYLGDNPSLRITARNGQEDLKERWVPEARCEPSEDSPKTGFGSG